MNILACFIGKILSNSISCVKQTGKLLMFFTDFLYQIRVLLMKSPLYVYRCLQEIHRVYFLAISSLLTSQLGRPSQAHVSGTFRALDQFAALLNYNIRGKKSDVISSCNVRRNKLNIFSGGNGQSQFNLFIYSNISLFIYILKI